MTAGAKMYAAFGYAGLALLIVVLWPSGPRPRAAHHAASVPVIDVAAVASHTAAGDVRTPVAATATQPAPQDERPTVTPPPLGASPDPDAVRAWAREVPGDALLWMATAPPGSTRDAVLELVCAEVVRFAPAEAVRLAEQYSGTNYHLRENLVHQWALQDGAAAGAYARRQPAGEFRNRLLSRIALTRAKDNPAEAARLVAREIAPGDVQDEARVSVVRMWAERDPGAARASIASFEDPVLAARAQREIEQRTAATRVGVVPYGVR